MMTAGVCAICGREGRGFGYDPALARRPGKPAVACSMTCLTLIAAWRKDMIDPTPNEKVAIRHGGAMGGELLDSLGKTDFALLTEKEWLTFVEAVITGYSDRLRELAAQDQARIDRMTATRGVPF